ncbi:MAG: hemolysin family protein [Parachlamydia sp.]|nr:hemolysin family protein [Parachlamydia sp.]
MYLIVMFLATILFLAGTFFLTALSSAFRRIHRRETKKLLKNLGPLFFYRPFHLYFFPEHEYEGLFFATVCAQNVTRFFYATSALLFLLGTMLVTDFAWFWVCFSYIGFLLAIFVIGDFLPRIFGSRTPEAALRFCAPVSSVFLFMAFPITYLFLRLSKALSQTPYFDYLQEPSAQAKQEIIDIVQKAELSPEIDLHDKKLIQSVLNFRNLLAREVMVPRVDLFSLSADVSIKDAAKLLENEGYSRTPVYRNTVDNIVGVLMYKDILSKFREYEEKGNNAAILNAPIETIQKPVLYTPETKKISQLLQEFRKKQVHLAIVVDEYGGTEGIVTIEDILEQIVGEIADEYDEAEALYIPQSDGSWIVDPRISILDAEEQLGITVPEEGDYDSLGGYIFHCAGAIPQKGFVIHRDEFEIEILRSSERSVEKVRIRPLKPPSD